ncbi:hypothetical protein ANN_16092 [Periplaneta americana]|uniref:Uncharacterized protein n=1 Tax=Periplaneta americana TaxID=6978 RepID=A0ABQ8SI08_PERAM|nr:hypothetical protein ANN_16092 [Periplaneta americana]
MSPGSNTESYPAFAHIGLRENPGKNLNQVTCPDRESKPGHLVSRPDALTASPFNLSAPIVLLNRTHRHDTTVHVVIRLLIPALYKNQSDSLMAADRDWHHLCKLMAPVRHRWSINDVIGGIRNTVMPSDCSPTIPAQTALNERARALFERESCVYRSPNRRRRYVRMT